MSCVSARFGIGSSGLERGSTFPWLQFRLHSGCDGGGKAACSAAMGTFLGEDWVLNMNCVSFRFHALEVFLLSCAETSVICLRFLSSAVECLFWDFCDFFRHTDPNQRELSICCVSPLWIYLLWPCKRNDLCQHGTLSACPSEPFSFF